LISTQPRNAASIGAPKEVTMVVLIIGVLGAAISAVIAMGKGRSALGWGVLGFLMPLIGVIVALCLAEAPKAALSEEAQL
jgi:hypothetical protein